MTIYSTKRASLKNLNSRRVSYIISGFICYGSLFIIVACLSVVFLKDNIQTSVFLFLDQKLPVIPPLVALFSAGGIIWIPSLIPFIKSHSNYRNFFENQFLSSMAEEFTNFRYQNQGIDRGEFEQSDIFDKYQIDIYDSKHGFFSEQRHLKIAWVETKMKVRVKNRTQSRPLFNGWFVQITLNQSLPSFLVLPQKKMFEFVKRFVGIHAVKKPSLKPVKVSNPNFETHFSVYGDLPAEIFDIAANLMTRYKILKEPVYLSLMGNKLYLAVRQSRNIFALPIKKVTKKKVRQWKEKFNFYITWSEELRDILNSEV